MNAHSTFPVDAPAAAPPGADGRERIVAALRARSAAAPTASALPALIEALPSDATRAPQTEFVRDLQVLFIENLSLTGSVRSAASAAGVSHQSAYRARRSCAHFRLAWDGALVAARVNSAETLACRAIDGIEEQVFYHGEVVATRRRYSDRLLLAHMARLDRLATDDPRAAAFAEDWDAAMARFADGEDPLPEPEPATPPARVPAEAGTSSSHARTGEAPAFAQARTGGDFFSSGLCNTRSMSPAPAASNPGAPDPSGQCGIVSAPPARLRKICCDEALWPQCRDCPDFDVLETIRAQMAEERPDDAPPFAALGDPAEVEECQIAVFQAGGMSDWWLVGAEYRHFEPDGAGGWRPEAEEVGGDPAARPVQAA